MTITTNAASKVAAVATGLVMAFSVFAAAPMAHAQSAADLQAQISSLLATIQALQAQLAATQGGSTGGSSPCSLTVDLTIGSKGADVTCLQNLLISKGHSIPAGATGYFGMQTQAAVAAWQKAAGITPAAGYVGPKSRAAIAAMGGGTTTVPGTPVTGNGLKVMLASDSPNGTALVQGQAIAELGKFTFMNPTSAAIKITSIAFNRIGASSDSTLSNVYLYQGAERLTDAAGISNTAFNFNDTAGIVTVPAGGMVTVSVRSDIAGSTSGQQVGVKLASVASTGTLDSSVALPISGGLQTISSASIGTVAITYTGPSGATENPGTDIRVFEGSTVVSTHAARLETITFENRGSTDDDDIKNLRLYVDGVMVGSSVAQLTNGRATFDLSSNPVRLETGTRIIKVMADVVGGSGETYDIEIRRAADIRVVDIELGQPILITGTWSGSANTVAAATLSVVRAANTPTTNVTVGATNVMWGKFEFRAAGEDVKIEAITFDVDQTAAAGMDNGKVFVNGVQVGSTRDIDAAGTEVTFGSSFIAKQGAVTIVELYGDAKTTAGTNFAADSTVDVGISIAAADTEGMDSGDTVSAISEVESVSRTMTASSASISKASGYGNQTLIAGTNNARLGSFTISTGATEGVNVNTITLSLSTTESGTITDLMLKDSATGMQVGTTKVAPSTTNSYSVNIAIPASGTKTYDVYGNIKSSSGAGTFIVDVDGSGTGAVTATSVTLSSVSLQTITIGSGTLTASVAAGNPVNMNAVAVGTGEVKVGSFTFNAANSAYTIEELKVKIPADAATSVGSVILKWAGNTAGVSQALSLSSSGQSHATATFAGLNFAVPKNDSADIDVYVTIPKIDDGAHTGAAISAVIDYNEGFKATDSAGSPTTSVGSADLNSAASSGYGTVYVKKSVPTLTRLATGYTSGDDTVAAGAGLYRFTIAADSNGAIEWRKISFAVATSGASFTNFTLYDVTGSATAVNSSAVAAVNTSGNVVIYVDTVNSNTVHSVSSSGGAKTYELRAAAVTGWGDAGDSVTVSFTEDTSAVVAQSSAALSDNMIWSDRASTSHTTITSDWTNGYLVKDVTNDTRTCQYGTATTCTP